MPSSSNAAASPSLYFRREASRDRQRTYSEMDVSGFGIAIVQARTIVTSIKDRIAKFKQGQHRFETLSANLDLLLKHLEDVELLVRMFPSALPPATVPLFNSILEDVRGAFKDNDFTVPWSLKRAFVASSSATDKLKRRVRQLTGAKTLSEQLNELQNKIDKASNRLQHLISVLANALKVDKNQATITSRMDEHKEAIMSKLDDIRNAQNLEAMCVPVAPNDDNHDLLLSILASLRVAETAKEVYSAVTSTPDLSETIGLDFQSKDKNGEPATPEGKLKQYVLCCTSSETVTAAAGVMKHAYGVLGMAGVGKTVALQGLGHDADILTRFCDGVHYMTFGRGATLQTAIREIAKIMTITGASAQVQNVKSANSLREAVDYAVPWFEGKVCLYLLDDLWPTESMATGYLLDLRQLLRGSPRSRMAICTRSFLIASDAGRVVNFEPRDSLGLESYRIFMANATRPSTRQRSLISTHDRSASVDKILSICGGLPIALAVTGCAVAKYWGEYGSFEKACVLYSRKLEDKRIWLGEESTPEGTSLNAAILLSLEFLQIEFGKKKLCEDSISDLYTSLCILENQVWVSVSILQRLWQLNEEEAMEVVGLFCEMSLATRHFRRPSSQCCAEPGIVLHDLQLDFCQRRAMEMRSSTRWHSKLLTGYLEATNQIKTEIPHSKIPQKILNYTPRPWWSTAVPNDGYIHRNLSRHLKCSGQDVELASLLLEGRWTQLRKRIGGILALQTDFELLDTAFEQYPRIGGVRHDFQMIFKAIRLSWGRMVKGLRVFQFQVCGRLARMRKSSAFVQAYLKSVENSTPKPYLLPVSSFFPEVDSSLITEISVGGECFSVASSKCGKLIACGAGNDIVISKTSSGEIMKRIEGDRGVVTCIEFAGGSKEIVSGSEDGTVMLWEWEFLRSRVFEGHKDRITGVAINASGERIFSSSRDKTLRMWNSINGEQIWELCQSSAVICVAACSREVEWIAFCLDDGTLRVVATATRDVQFEDNHNAKCVSFSPNGSYLATGSSDKTIRLWNTGSWTREGEHLYGHKSWVTCVSFGTDGKQIASSSPDGTIRLWELKSGNCVGRSPKIISLIESISISADGQRIVSGSKDSIVRVWDARLGMEEKEICHGHSDLVWGVGISRNGLQLASASRDRTVRLWDTQSGEQVGVPLSGHENAALCVSFSPDGRLVVSGSADNKLRLWDTGTHTQIGDPFEGHTESVRSVSMNVDGLRTVSGSYEGTVRIWNTETQQQIGEQLQGISTAVIYCVSVSSDGCYIVSRDRTGISIIWNCDNRSIVWTSEHYSRGYENRITNEEAESIIRCCGQQTPHLWPKSFPAYTGHLYCEGDSVYSNLLGERTLLADTLIEKRLNPCWSYHSVGRIFSAGLGSGAVAVCKLIIE